jgi:hypothetical protein
MQNRLYALRAMDRLGLLEDGKLREALAEKPALDWLVSEEGARWAILAELGRIRDSGAFDTAVRWVLEYRPRTKEAVARIRRFRIGKSNPPDTNELADEVVRAVDDYATRHPGITPGQALEALGLAIQAVAGDRGLARRSLAGCLITQPAETRSRSPLPRPERRAPAPGACDARARS